MDWNEFQRRYPQAAVKMSVYSQDGEKLGRVEKFGESGLLVEKGRFFHKEFYSPYEDVLEVREGELFLRFTHEELLTWRSQGFEGWFEHERELLFPEEAESDAPEERRKKSA